MPARSPFASQRVYLTKPNLAQKMAAHQSLEEDPQALIPVTVLVDNVCAAQQCQPDSPDAEDSTTCRLTQERMIPQLNQTLQAYAWEVPTSATEASVEKYLNRNQTDQDCIVGLSITRQYKTKQAIDPLNPLAQYQYQHQVLRTAEAMSFFSTQGLQSVRVGIVDTGVDFAHEDLAGISGGMDWPSSNPRCTGICNGHGTFVAGLIAAKKDNSKGGYGIAPNASITSYRVGNAAGEIETAELYNALIWSMQVDHVEIMNLSLGGSSLLDQTIQDAMVRMIQNDTLVVVAAGNDGRNLDQFPIYPAAFNYDGQINVASASPAAVDPATNGPYQVSGSPIQLDSFSNYSAGLVHIAAPGQSVYSTLPNNAYTKWSGTSFSTPLVVGALVVLKGYLKAKGFTNISAPILKELLLEGSRRLPSLEGKVAETKYLDLVLLKNAAQSFVATMNANPVQVSLISSGAVTIGATKHVRVQVEVTGGTAGAGQILRAYTNRAFLEDSNTHITCEINQQRQFCTFDIPYDRLYIDPEVYFVLTTASGEKIADLNIPKTSLELGVRADAQLQGAIIHAVNRPDYLHAEGWACLTGFADPITIEVRHNSPTGPVIRTLQTIRQARGDFFSRCQAPSIDFGFTFLAPRSHFNGAEHRYFFKAIHPGTGKTLDLPVLSYQPLSADPRPPESTTSVFLDPLVSEKAIVKITKYEVNDWVADIEGTACLPLSKKPVSLGVYLHLEDPYSLFPSLDAILDRQAATVVANTKAQIRSFTKTWRISNSEYVAKSSPAEDRLGYLKECTGPPLSFSDISEKCTFSFHQGNAPKSVNLLVSRNLEQPGMGPAHEIEIISNSWVENNFYGGAIFADLDRQDGCFHPSGFSVRIDLKKQVSHVEFAAWVNFREDKISPENYRDQLPPADVALVESGPPESDFSKLRKLKSALRPMMTVVGQPYSLETKTASTFIFKSWNDFKFSPEHFKTISLNPAIAAGAALTNIYETPVAVTPSQSTLLFVSIDFIDGVKLGELGSDLRLEFAINGQSTWYDSNLDVETSFRSQSTGKIHGTLGAKIDLPAATNSIQFRIRANNKSNLQMFNFGYLAQ